MVLFFGFSFSQNKTTKEIQGDHAYRIHNYNKAIVKYETRDLTWQGVRNYAHALEELGQTISAEKQYAKLIKLTDSNHLDDYFHYANLLKVNGKNEEYLVSMDLFSKLNPLDSRSVSFLNNKKNFEALTINNSNIQIELLTINTAHSDFGTTFWKDKIVFTSNYHPSLKWFVKDSRTNEPYLNMYVADLEGVQIVNPRLFDRNLKIRRNDGPASFAKNGSYMAYTSNHVKDRSIDRMVELQIQFSAFENEHWTDPVAFSFNDASYSVGQPYLTEKGDTMYFTSDMPGGFGGKDIYLTTWSSDGSWTSPLNLGHKINTESDEMFPFYDQKSGLLYFASDGHFGLGGLDVFYFYKGEVVNIGAPINSRQDDFALITKKDGKNGYFSSNRTSGKGSDDLYGVYFESDLPFEPKLTILEVDSIETSIITTNQDQMFSADSTVEIKNPIAVEKLENIKNDETFNVENVIRSIELKTIYFDFDKADIRNDAALVLDQIVSILNAHPSMEISINTHTDCRGSMEYNQYLSDLRAQETATYIQQRITQPQRISAIGYSETKRLNSCECQDHVTSLCTIFEHQENRRAEFVVVKF